MQTRLSSFVSRHWYILLSALIIGLVLFIIFWSSPQPLLGDVLKNGLVYSNKFDDTTIQQNLSADRNGTPSSAVLLDGIDDYVITGDTAGNVSNDFSICFWIKPLRRDTAQLLILKGENCPDGNPHFVGMSFEVRILATNRLYAKIVAPDGNHTDEYIEMESELPVPVFKWMFVSIRYDNTAKVFDLTFNQLPQNIKQASKTARSNFCEIYQPSSPLKLGVDENYCGYRHQFSSHYRGYLDDVFILGRRISDSELELISSNRTSYTFWERKSVAINISIVLLALAAAWVGLVKWGDVIVRSVRNAGSAAVAKYDFEDVTIFCTIACGAALAVWQFIFNRGLWTDEMLLALNIVSRNPLELLQPLDFYVVGPILFLELEKLFSWLVPDTDMSLRVLPILAYLAASYFFYRVLTKMHTNKYAILVGIALFAFNSPLIYYASEVKQYMVDVLVVSLIYFLLLRDYEDLKSKFIYLGVVGTICIWISNIAPIILLTAGVFLVFQHGLRDVKIRLNLMAVSAMWTVTFGFYFYFFIWDNPAKGPMLAYWIPLNVFAPNKIFSMAFLDFLLDKWKLVRGRLFQFGPGAENIFNLLAFIGLISLVLRRKIHYLILACLPVLVHVLLSSYMLYPVDMRLILYQCPMFIILFSFGIKELAGLLFADLKIERIRILTFIIPLWLGILFFSNGFYLTSFPFKHQEFKKTIAYVNRNLKPGDGIYIAPLLHRQFNYYSRYIPFKVVADAIYLGKNHGTPEGFARDLSSLHGRQWVMANFYGEEQILLKLKDLGYTPELQFDVVGARVYLFDFK